MANIQPQIVQPVQAQNQAVMQPCIAQPAAQQQPALKPFYFDFVEMEHWFLVDPAFHTMMGGNKLKIRDECPHTGLPVERVATVKYKTTKRQYFRVMKQLKADDVWIAT